MKPPKKFHSRVYKEMSKVHGIVSLSKGVHANDLVRVTLDFISDESPKIAAELAKVLCDHLNK